VENVHERAMSAFTRLSTMIDILPFLTKIIPSMCVPTVNIY
jgi:hypothetical protein